LSLNQVQAELNDWAVANNKSAEFQNITTAFQQHLNTSLNYLNQTITNSSLSAAEQATAFEFVTLITDPDTPRDEIHDELQTKWDSLDNQTQADFLQAFGPIIAVIRAKFGFSGSIPGASGGSSGLSSLSASSISSAFSQLTQQLGGSSSGGSNTGSNPTIQYIGPPPPNGAPNVNVGQPSTGARTNLRSSPNGNNRNGGNRRNGNNRNSGSNRGNSTTGGTARNRGILRRRK